MKETFSIDEVAALLGRSRQSIIRLFEDEPGILVFERPERLHKRRYRTIIITRAVLERVLRRLSKGGVMSVKFLKRSLR